MDPLRLGLAWAGVTPQQAEAAERAATLRFADDGGPSLKDRMHARDREDVPGGTAQLHAPDYGLRRR